MVESGKLQSRETNMVRARVGTGLSIEGPGGGSGLRVVEMLYVLWEVTLLGFSNRTEEISFLVCELYLSIAA